jgi:hypothetical protein
MMTEIPDETPSPLLETPDVPGTRVWATEDPVGVVEDRTFALTRLLRGSGAVLLLVSALTFLLQQWAGHDDVFKYGLLVGQTLVLVAAAFLCGIKVKESRSARTLFGLALASVPVHFAVLGGLVYSQWGQDHLAGALPKYVVWHASSPAVALGALAVGLVVLLPVAYVSLLALVRVEAPRMLGLMFGLNAFLLLPVRNPDFIGVAAAAGALLLAALEAGPFRRSITLGTFEGKLARLLLAVPPVLLLGRAAFLYAPTLFFIGTCLLAIGLVIFALAPVLLTKLENVAALRCVATLLAFSGWVTAGMQIAAAIQLPAGLVIPACGLPFAALLIGLGRHAGKDGPGYRRAAEILAFVTVMANVVLHGSISAALAALFLGLVLLAVGTYRKRKLALASGAVAAITGLVVQIQYAFGFERWMNWGSLSILGIALVIIAALIERHPERLAATIAAFTKRREEEV